MTLIDKNKLWDRRIVDRNVEKGLLSKEELGNRLTKLPDETANAVFVDANIQDADFSGDFESLDDK